MTAASSQNAFTQSYRIFFIPAKAERQKMRRLAKKAMFTTAFYSKRNQPIRHSILKALQYVAY